MPETARDRMAYMVWCVKMERPDLFTTGDNPFLNPSPDMHFSWDYQTCYSAADTMLAMLRSDVFAKIRGGKQALVEGTALWGDPWTEGISDALEALGWKQCLEYNDELQATCQVQVTWEKPHSENHVGYSRSFDNKLVSWPVKKEK